MKYSIINFITFYTLYQEVHNILWICLVKHLTYRNILRCIRNLNDDTK